MIYLIFIPIIGPLLCLIIGPIMLLKTKKIYDFSLIMIFGRLSNPVLYNHISNYDVLWWLAIYISLIICVFSNKPSNIKVNKGIGFFMLICTMIVFIFSSINSIDYELSLFKTFNWIIITILLVLGSNIFNYCTKIFNVFLICLLILSIITIPFPAISYARDNAGFQGIINHPQSFAVLLSLLTVFSFSNSKNKSKWLLIIVVIILLYLTRARTGFLTLLALILPLTIKSLYELITLKFSSIILRLLNYIKPFFLLTLICSFGVMYIGSDQLKKLIYKSDENTNIEEALEDSRGFIMKQQISNFKNNPIFGIGFGIANSDSHEQKVKNFNGIPINASTEKANLPLALLEETGIIGFITVIPFIFFITNKLDIVKIFWIAILLSNLSEFTFFSYGSFGLLSGVIISKIYKINESSIPIK
jgi:hypothetical protein